MGIVMVVEDKSGNKWLRVPPTTRVTGAHGPEEEKGYVFINVSNISAIIQSADGGFKIEYGPKSETFLAEGGFSFDDLCDKLFSE